MKIDFFDLPQNKIYVKLEGNFVKSNRGLERNIRVVESFIL